MMSKDESEMVKMVYNRFMESETEDWTKIDDNLEFYAWLSDSDLVKEAKIKYGPHSKGTLRCSQDHEQINCFAPRILEAVEAIIKLYDQKKQLHSNNAYILSYYLVLSELDMIYPC